MDLPSRDPDLTASQKALQESEERYRTLFNSIDEGFCVIEVLFDDNGKAVDYIFLETNPAFERQTGIRDAVSRRMRELVPVLEEHWFEIYGRVAKTGESARFQKEAKALDRYYDVYAFRVGTPEQNRVGVVFNDITRRRRSEKALLESERQYRELVEQVKEYAIFRTDLRGCAVTWNEGVQRVLGFAEHEFINCDVIETIFTPEDLKAGIAQKEFEIAAERGMASNDRWMRRKSGERFFAQGTTTAIKDAEGRVTGFTKVMRDSTQLKEAEEKLRESEERYRVSVESQSELFCRFRLDGSVVFTNRAYARAVGLSPEELEHHNFWEFIPEQEHAHVRIMLENLAEEAPEIRVENRFKTSQGERWFLWINRALTFGNDGRPIEIQSFGVDITDRKQIEEALREREERYELVVSGAEAAIWDWDVPNKRVIFSPRWKAMRGLSDEDVGDGEEEWVKDIHPQDVDRVMAAVRAHFERRTPVFSEEYRVRHKKGHWIWILDRGIARWDEAGNVIRMAGSETNITERKQAEIDLEFQKYALDQSSIVAITDVQGTITYVNDKFCEISGYSREELLGQNHRVINSGFHPREFFSNMYKTISHGKVWRAEIRNRRKDGSYYWVDTTIVPAMGPDGKPQRYVAIRNDITERKAAEEAIRESEARYRELSERLEELVQERTAKLEEQTVQLRLLTKELTETEQRERKRLAEILHDHLQQLLIASKMRLDILEKHAPELHRDIHSARDFIDEAIAASRSLSAELRPPALYEGGLAPALKFLARKMQEQYHLRVHLHIEQDIQPDNDFVKIMVYQSIQEILLNTVKHAQVDECFVSMKICKKQNLHIKILDRGVGFDPALLSDSDRAGFGLLNIRERIRILGGDFRMESAPGHGSVFDLYVPYKSETIAIKEEAGAQGALESIRDLQAIGTSKGVRVLLADDHRIVREGIRHLLNEQESIEVVDEADNGEEAVAKAINLQPDIVIMDINMPKMNGIEATRILQARMPNVKVIGLSVQSEQETIEAMTGAGAVAFFNKDQDTSQLVESIRSLFPSDRP